MDKQTPHARLGGLDLARFLAFTGMVLVNFGVVASLDTSTPASFPWLEGRAAALFVVLAGLGLGLSARTRRPSAKVQFRRAGFLLVLGLLNALVFPADILHFYAFYFALGFFCLPLKSRALFGLIILINVGFLTLLMVFNYDQGWDWQTLTYEGFWTPIGMFRNLVFNGWHPILPWFGFFVLGLVLAQLNLQDRAAHHWLIWIGAGMLVFASLGAVGLKLVFTDAPLLAWLFTTAPIPPTPLYFLAGAGAACLIIGLCLRCQAFPFFQKIEILAAPAGRQTLTLYIAHILIGMPILLAMQPANLSAQAYAMLASLIFILATLIYAHFWTRHFSRGPLEMLMRRLDRL